MTRHDPRWKEIAMSQLLATLSWPHVLGLAGFGVVMGLLVSLAGLKQKQEVALWLAVYFAMVLLVRVTAAPHPFTTVLLASVLAGVLSATTTMLLFGSYVRKNPWYATEVQKPRGQLAGGFYGMGLMMGAIFGAIFGGIAWALQRWA
jgi:hypothetical protein